MMRKLFAIVAILATLTGCPKKTDGAADAADDAPAPVAAPAAPAPPVAKNVNDVARFPAGEKALADDDQKIVDPFTVARTNPHAGANVATLKAGTDPYKIAEFQDAILVTFPDPKDANSNLMGWIPKSSFTTAGHVAVVVDAGIATTATGLKCAAGQEAIVNIGAAPICKRKCTLDKDCRTAVPGACAAASTTGGKITKVCVNEAP